jgi:hypothetical protein
MKLLKFVLLSLLAKMNLIILELFYPIAKNYKIH